MLQRHLLRRQQLRFRFQERFELLRTYPTFHRQQLSFLSSTRQSHPTYVTGTAGLVQLLLGLLKSELMDA